MSGEAGQAGEVVSGRNKSTSSLLAVGAHGALGNWEGFRWVKVYRVAGDEAEEVSRGQMTRSLRRQHGELGL